jgi:ubiquitin carboxyl-terminal hydrolase 5/13
MNTLMANSATSTNDWKHKLSLLTPSCCRVASTHDVVYNDECVYTFHSPFSSEKGILVNLVTFLATCEDYIQCNINNSNEGEVYTAFVRIVKQKLIKKKQDKEEEEKLDDKDKQEQAVPITKLGVGIEGGFPTSNNQEVVIANYSIVLWHNQEGNIDLEVPFLEETSSSIFPEYIISSVQSIAQHVGTQLQQDVQTWELEEEPKPVSKFCYTLPFVDNGVTVSPNPKDWRCQMYPNDSDNTDTNLWLNLSDGFIGGGRRHWDGSGATNGALDHYMQTNKQYPLVVKLGTITSDPTTADCYSYDPEEDGPVLIPNLAELLAKRGILVSSL